MTYIEFYDSLSVVNICACLANVPDRVVLVGGDQKDVLESIDLYRRIFRGRGYDVEFIHCPLKNKNDLNRIVDELLDIVDRYPDCAVDLTGGDNLELVAMGVVYQMRREKNIQLHRFNLHNNAIHDCDQDGTTIAVELPRLSVEENIRIYGGDIVYEEDMPGTTKRWDITADFEHDIDIMWSICRRDPKAWNIHVNALNKAHECFGEEEAALELDFSIEGLANWMGDKYVNIKPFLEELYCKGVLYFYYASGDAVSLIYKNSQTRQCLSKAGTLLEMKVYRMLLQIPDKDGTPMYNDVMQGVFIDWDNWTQAARSDTANEVDVVAMKGMVPVFISCKNGQVRTEELYKLQSVAERFGRGYAKKVLIATSLDDELPATQHFRQRARDMKIRIIDDLHQMSDAQIISTFKQLWR